MHTVELLPDAALEAGVRELWERLAAAGLPSLATHRHPTNRPHLTLLTARSLAGLPPLPLPSAVTLGPVRMLGHALVRVAVVAGELRSWQAAAWAALPGPWPPPADFVPHLSLALKVPPARRAAALGLLAGLPPAGGRFVAARSYDTETREVSDPARAGGG